MAIYEYYCPTCHEKFEERRPMSQAAVATKCAQGHPAERTLSAFAMTRGGAAGGMLEMDAVAGGGGCCGGGACACSN